MKMKNFFLIVIITFSIFLSTNLFPQNSYAQDLVRLIPGTVEENCQPAIWGDRIVWVDIRNGNWDIYMYDLAQHAERAICVEGHRQARPAIYDDIIVWEDYREGKVIQGNAAADIYYYDVSSGENGPLWKEGYSFQPAIYGKKVVWAGFRGEETYGFTAEGHYPITDGEFQLYMYDFSTGQGGRITSETDYNDPDNNYPHWYPAIYENKVVCERWRGPYNTSYKDIYLYDISAAQPVNKAPLYEPYTVPKTPICTERGTRQGGNIVDIYKDKIVWSDFRNGNWDIYMYDLSTNEERAICTDGSNQFYPTIYYNKIVWTDTRSGNSQIYMRDINEGSTTILTSSPMTHWGSNIYHGIITWTEHNTAGYWDLYAYFIGDDAPGRIPVQRVYGASRYDTAVSISREGWVTSKTVVLARGDLYPDALAGSPLAAKFDCPILLTDPKFLTDASRAEIIRLGASEIFVLGSEDALYPQVVTDLETKCHISNTKIHRIGGVDRYETAALIAGWLDKPQNQMAIIATGENYPDALSASGLAYVQKIPILLVTVGEISPYAQSALKKLNIKKVLILGGSDVVSTGIENWLANHNYETKRLQGDDRYGTAKAVADYTIENKIFSSEIAITTGENFPDALCIGPYAGKKKGIIVLVSRDFLRPPSKEFLEEHKDTVSQVIVTGGSDVVTNRLKDEIKRMM